MDGVRLGPEVFEMTPIRKLNENLEGLVNERYSNLRKVKRKDYHDSGGEQRQFRELVDEFNTAEEQNREGRKERDKDKDKADIDEKSRRRVQKDGRSDLEILQNKASYRATKPKDDDSEVGTQLDINI